MQVQPYLFFDGRCEEAVEFYRSALGAEVEMLMRFKESPEQCDDCKMPSGSEDKVMHASFRIGNSTVMASDGQCKGEPSFQGFSLSLTASSDAEAERLFVALGDGGKVQMPMAKTFFCFTLRHGCRSLRGILDGHRRALSGAAAISTALAGFLCHSQFSLHPAAFRFVSTKPGSKTQ